MRNIFFIVLLFLMAVVCADAQSLIHGVRLHAEAPLYIDLSRKSRAPGDLDRVRGKGWVFTRPQVWGDRFVYEPLDRTAQFMALLPMPDEGNGMDSPDIVIRITSRDDKRTFGKRSIKAADHRVSFMVDLAGLEVGEYSARVALVRYKGPVIARANFDFALRDSRGRGQGRGPGVGPGVVGVPREGIEVVLERQGFVRDVMWPVRTGVPLPRGAVFDGDVKRFALYENGRRVAVHVEPIAYWSPGDDSSIQWVHVDFLGRYADGEPAEYRLKLEAQPIGRVESPLKFTQTAEAITVDTGQVKFVVNRKRFTGIERAWYDATGRGEYDERSPVLGASEGQTFGGAGGGYLVDEGGKRYEAAGDRRVDVRVEHASDVRVTIVARGWYARAGRDRLCKFVTRISAYAGQPTVQVGHDTYITFDTDQKQLADLGFVVPTAQASTFSMGVDGRTVAGNLPVTGDVFLHQDRADRLRIVGMGESAGGRRSDGWFSVVTRGGGGSGRGGGDNGGNGGQVAVSALVRDVWRKFPKQVSMARGGLTIHFWPRDGHEAFDHDQQMAFENLYKFLCFHQGRLMDLKTPAVYVKRFDDYAKGQAKGVEGSHLWWRPSEHDGTRDGNAQGVVIGNQFALHFGQPPKESPVRSDENPAGLGALFDDNPSALASPVWNCSTGALGPIPMAAVDGEHFSAMEEAQQQGYLSWMAGSVARYNDYGMFNYADTHTVHRVDLNRPGLHRVWQGSHYHHMGTNWLHYYRSGSPAKLRWARANTDHYMNIDVTNYVDEANPVQVRDHDLGAMQHMGWKTHWASSAKGGAWGQYKDVFGHFIDPDAMLWCWYLTGNQRAREAYGFWHESIRGRLNKYMSGKAREFNTTLSYLISCYRATWDPTLLPAIHSVALSLRSVPLEQQRPGPLWHPWWMVRYHDLTRDPSYEDWILHYAQVGLGYPWPLALAAKAYWLSGDVKYLQRLLPRVALFPRKFFRKADDAYDWWGPGPGPLGSGYAYMSWGIFLAALHDAKIDELPAATEARGGYPFTSSRWPGLRWLPSLTVYALESRDRAFTVRQQLYPLGGSLHAASAVLYGPDDQQVYAIERLGVTAPNEARRVEADGQSGLYRLEYRSHEAGVPLPQTDLAVEAAMVRCGVAYRVINSRAWWQPRDRSGVYELTVTALDQKVVSCIVEDADGVVLLDASLFASRPARQAVVTLDPSKHKLPWVIDVVGKASLQFDGSPDRSLLVGADRANIQKIEAALQSQSSSN